MKSPDTFWRVVASYNNDTWWVRVLLIPAGIILTIILYMQIAQPALHPVILDLITRAKLYNHTLWLKIPVEGPDLLEGLKDLLV